VTLTPSSKPPSNFQTVKHPSTLPLSGDHTQWLHVHFSASQKTDEQVMLLLSSSEPEGGSALLPPISIKDSYQFKLSLSSPLLIEPLKGRPSTLKLRILLANEDEQMDYHFASLHLKIPESAAKDFDEAESLYRIKQEIKHTFRSAEQRPVFILPVLFACFAFLPLLALVYALSKRVAIKMPTDAAEFTWAAVFQVAMVTFVALYVLYWIKLNIFQAFIGVAILTPVGLISGNRALRAVHQRKRMVPKQATE